MPRTESLDALADALGVFTAYVDGLNRPVEVSDDALVRVCAALGAEIATPADAGDALAAWRERSERELLPPAVVAWDGRWTPLALGSPRSSVGRGHAELRFEGDGRVTLDVRDGRVCTDHPLPFGYHRLVVEVDGRSAECAVIAAPVKAWRPPGSGVGWGVATHLAALRSRRSRSVGDLRDLERLSRWVAERGGDLVTVLPLLPTFNEPPAEPSPYAPVSRLFWSELVLDLGAAGRAAPDPARLDVGRASAEVRAAMAAAPDPDRAALEAELLRYARFRGAQARLGRDWRSWPAPAREGRLTDDLVDPVEERFHLVVQTEVRRQLHELVATLGSLGVRLGLDLSVGAHPDGYDPWSRPGLFAEGLSVGAPPDPGFPSGQDWGFAPVLPTASRREGHAYLAASIAHQASVAGVLRVDHVMALRRLYCIPHGAGLHEGTYVGYPTEELFAVLTLESHRNECEVIGENLGTVPGEVDAALTRHGIAGMYLAEFEAYASEPAPPSARDVALIGTHDTPTLRGWLEQVDIDERVRTGLLAEEASGAERVGRTDAAERLARAVGGAPEQPRALLERLLDWLGSSPSECVVVWLEDLWLEREQVNLPGTRSSERPNWQRPMRKLLDEALADGDVDALVRHLDAVRRARWRAAPADDIMAP